MSSWRDIIRTIYPDMREFSVKVMGNSMFPTIKAGESVPVLMRDDIKFCIGDILVFRYKNEGFLIHRLLQKKGQIYYCKGDNSIRMESVGKETILGLHKLMCPQKVILNISHA